jgi:hypothetical protein
MNKKCGDQRETFAVKKDAGFSHEESKRDKTI